MGWFRAGSGLATLAIRRTLSQGGSYATRTRILPSQNRYFHTTVFRSKAQAAPVPRPVPLSRLTDSFLDGTSSVYLEELQRAWEADPSSVDESWDNFFRNFVGHAATSPGISGQTIQESMRFLLLVRAYQVNGHTKAKLDPLGLEEREIPAELDPALYGFTEADLDREFFLGVWTESGFLSENRPVQTLRSILTRLEQAYCGSIGQRREVMLDRLIWSTQFENFLATKWTTAKRFGLEGGETLIPGMKEMFDRAADLGVESIVIGMPHRGRLNVLGNVVRKPLRQIFSEFSGGTKPVDEIGLYTGTGDVKYHLGTSYDRPTRGGKRIHLSLVANPSHLEAVDPVVVGKTRAKQYYSNDEDRTKNMGVLIHGDGSFAGQEMGWFRAGSGLATLAIRRTLSQGGSYATRTRILPSQNRYFHTTVFRSKAQAAPVPRPVPLSRLTDSFLDGTSSVYLEELQRAWEADPSSVDESWDNFFRNFVGHAATSPGISGQTIQESMRLLLLVRAYQVNGHTKAKLDPLGLEEREIPAELDPALYGFTEADLDREFFLGVWTESGFLSENRPVQTLRSILTRLEQAYCGSIGFEYMHIANHDKCNWLREKIETPTPMEYNRQRREVMLDRLIWSTQFENFLATKWTTAKRFGLEGGETLIPGMKEMFDRAADLGVESIVIGMPHRGRLNVLGNVVRKPLRQIFSEFSGGTKPVDEIGLYTGTGDVKYHLGTSYDRPTRGGKRIHLSLVANPSHLEAVDPVVVGKTRAKQYYSNVFF
nr:2-oxoglutarate dehydrogenase, mitochondrial [Quercus suber]